MQNPVMSQILPFHISDGKFVLFALIGVIAAFAILIVLVNAGSVRHVQIFLPEKTEDTIVFRNIDGKVAVVGTKGMVGVNPYLMMRTGDYALELTVINEDTAPHMLYVDGVNVHTKVLRQGESDVIKFYSKGEATYNYYDAMSNEPLGQIQAIRVTMFE